jgi:hypothetical protein
MNVKIRDDVTQEMYDEITFGGFITDSGPFCFKNLVGKVLFATLGDEHVEVGFKGECGMGYEPEDFNILYEEVK